jgi:hypothetical protein
MFFLNDALVYTFGVSDCPQQCERQSVIPGRPQKLGSELKCLVDIFMLK